MDDINVDDIADELASSGMMSAEVDLDGFASHAPSDDTLGMNLLINPKKKLDVVEDEPIPEEEEPVAYETMPGVPAPNLVVDDDVASHTSFTSAPRFSESPTQRCHQDKLVTFTIAKHKRKNVRCYTSLRF